MKKILQCICLVLFLSGIDMVVAQNKIFHIGYGLGSSIETPYFLLSDRKASLYLGAERTQLLARILDNERADFLSLGWYLNPAWHRTDDFIFGSNYEAHLVSMGMGFRADLRILDLVEFIIDDDLPLGGLDVYTGLNTGPEFVVGFDDVDVDFEIYYRARPFVGVRYLLNDVFGAFLEVGRIKYGIVNVGISFGRTKNK